MRRPAVVTTAAISAVSVSAAGYASASGAVGQPVAGTGGPTADAALGAANAAVNADAAAQTRALHQAVAARAAATRNTDVRLAKRDASASAMRHKAQMAGKKKHKSVARAQAKAQARAKALAKQRQQKAAATSRDATRQPVTQATGGSPKAIAASMLGSYGWGQDQMGCLTSLWNKESGWNVYATNPSSGAYGIPQSLPGSKMASAGADWRTNPATQIKWGLGYIKSTYGSPCSAWGHSQATGWY